MGWQVAAEARPEIVQTLGSLHLLHAFLARLDLARLVNRLCGPGPSATFTYGDVFASLVLCRLSAGPHLPLYTVEPWTHSVAFEAVTGLHPAGLNDDRLGRCLDALFPHVERLKAAIALQAVQEFGLDLHHCLWDVTSVLLTGVHPDQDQAPRVRRGYSRSGAPKRRQFRLTTVAARDGAVPILHQVWDGNTEDTNTVVPAFEALREALHGLAPDRLLLSGDTKASGAANLLQISRAGCYAVAPLATNDRLQRVLRTQLPALQPLAYGRQETGPQAGRVQYWGTETTWKVAAPGYTPEHWRLLVIRSAEERRAVRKNRRKQYDRLIAGLQELRRKLASPYYRDFPERIAPAVAKLQAGARGVRPFIRVTVSAAPAGQVSALTWQVDRAALRAAMALDGVYGLVTNLPPADTAAAGNAPAGQSLEAVLESWKEQKHLEKRFRNLKGPLAVAPVFLSKPQRIVALILVLMTALLAFTLLEREVRQNLPTGQETLTGLLAPGVKSRPTGQSILRACRWLQVRWVPGSADKTLLGWTALHAELYRLAGVAVPRAG